MINLPSSLLPLHARVEAPSQFPHCHLLPLTTLIISPTYLPLPPPTTYLPLPPPTTYLTLPPPITYLPLPPPTTLLIFSTLPPTTTYHLHHLSHTTATTYPLPPSASLLPLPPPSSPNTGANKSTMKGRQSVTLLTPRGTDSCHPISDTIVSFVFRPYVCTQLKIPHTGDTNSLDRCG